MNIISTTVLPGTINFHINWHCNADCVFCYRPQGAELSASERKTLIRVLAAVPILNNQTGSRRINFAGGEPTLVKTLPSILDYARSHGLSTSLITNGTVYHNKPAKLRDVVDKLDMIGFSIDSINEPSNHGIQRPHFSAASWLKIGKIVRNCSVYLKVNTTVSRFNLSEDLSSFIADMNPDRWKILQAIAVEGTIGTRNYRVEDWIVSNSEFSEFIAKHAQASPSPVVETDRALRGSYAMISPDGRFYDSTQGHYTWSDPILEVGVEEAFAQVTFSQYKFLQRGGEFSIPVVAG